MLPTLLSLHCILLHSLCDLFKIFIVDIIEIIMALQACNIPAMPMTLTDTDINK